MTAQDENRAERLHQHERYSNLFTITEKSGMGVLTGTIDGAACGEPASDLKDLGNGDFEFTMMHYFLTRMAPGCIRTFRSRGWIRAIDGESAPGQHSFGVVRFEGAIRRK